MKKSLTTARIISLLLLSLLTTTAVAAQQRRKPGAPPSSPTATPPARPANTPPSGPATPREEEVAFEALLPADSYMLYGEMRMLGQQMLSRDFVDLMEPLQRFIGTPKEMAGVTDFLTAHADMLATARVMLVALPVKTELPQVITAVELASIEQARKLEPELRKLLASLPTPATAPGTESGAKKSKATARKQPVAEPPAKAKPSPPSFSIQRLGRLLLLSGSPFKPQSLKPASGAAFSDESTFQSARGRFTAEPLFIYFNIELMERNAKERRETLERQATEVKPAPVPPIGRDAENATATLRTNAPPPSVAARPDPSGTGNEARAKEPAVVSPEQSVVVDEPNSDAEVTPVAPETDTVVGISAGKAEDTPEGNPFHAIWPMLMSRLLSAPQKWPEAVALAAALEGDGLIVRALVIDSGAPQVVPLPFVPLLISGPAQTASAPSVLPADTNLLITASLDLPKMYDAALAALERAQPDGVIVGTRALPATDSQPLNAGIQIAALEKLFGFKIKDELLAALGNEVAISMPAEWMSGPAPDKPPASGQKAVAGPIVLVAVSDKEALRALLPRVLKAFGLNAAGLSLPTEKRGDVEIVNLGAGAYALIGDFLVLAPDTENIRRVADAYNNHETLASSQQFKNSTSWQPQQTLGRVYVSSALMKSVLEAETKRALARADEQTRTLLAQFDLEPGAITHAMSKDNLGALHELRVPKSLLSMLMAHSAVLEQQAPVEINEAMAQHVLRMISEAQEAYQKGKGHGRFATLEELTREKLLRKELLKVDGYKIEVNALGDKYEATATPTDYGKTGYLSFYLDQTGVTRGGDLGGRKANAADKQLVQPE